MAQISVIDKSKLIRVGKEPAVLAPLSLWKKVEDYPEDQESLASPKYMRRISRARKQAAGGKLVFHLRSTEC